MQQISTIIYNFNNEIKLFLSGGDQGFAFGTFLWDGKLLVGGYGFTYVSAIYFLIKLSLL